MGALRRKLHKMEEAAAQSALLEEEAPAGGDEEEACMNCGASRRSCTRLCTSGRPWT